MERFDLLHFIHKALRHAMLTCNIESGRVDFADADATKRFDEAWSALRDNLGLHAHHEDEIIFPLLEERAPGETHELARDHVTIHGLEDEMSGLLGRISDAPDEALRRLLGHEFHRAMQHYTAVCLSHFDHEERHLMPRLWALYEDGDLEAAFGRIMATIGPDERDFTMAHMAQALDPVELEALHARLGAEAPS